MILLSGSLVLPFASTQHIFHSPVLGTCFVCRLLFWRDYVYLGQLCLSKGVLCVLIHKRYVRSIKSYCFFASMLRLQYSLKLSIIIIIIIVIIIIIITQFSVARGNCPSARYATYSHIDVFSKPVRSFKTDFNPATRFI